jgi:hypothetical protein
MTRQGTGVLEAVTWDYDKITGFLLSKTVRTGATQVLAKTRYFHNDAGVLKVMLNEDASGHLLSAYFNDPGITYNTAGDIKNMVVDTPAASGIRGKCRNIYKYSSKSNR